MGCKLNFSETSTIAREFEAGDFVRARKGEAADIYVVNTCSVTEHADKKCRNLIRRITKENQEAIVAVTGCYAQLKPHDIAAIEGVDLVIGNNDKGSVFERIAALSGKKAGVSAHSCEVSELTGFFSAFSSGDRTRAFLKVQDGCDYRCAYCTVPLARGASRNIPTGEIVAQAGHIASQGQREIVITGINTGDFGRTTGESFPDLLRALDRVEGISRYRISSIEPNLLTDEIIEFTAASQKFQPHFHIPLQSGSNRILGLMGRRYNAKKFADRIEAARRLMPCTFFGIDVIVGFPGETEEDFMDTYRLLESVRPAFLHVFPYSVRANTPAAGFESKVPPPVAADRVKRLMELSGVLHNEFYSKYTGTDAEVLWESTRRGSDMSGYTGNYIKVRAPFDRNLINKITGVRLGAPNNDGTVDAAITGAWT